MSHMVSHVTCDWVIMSRVIETCETWVRHVTYEWVMSYQRNSDEWDHICDLIHIDVHPIAFGVSFLHSCGITFICDLIHVWSHSYRHTAYCIWSVISSFSNLIRWSSSLGLFNHVPLKRDQEDCDWRLRFNDTPIAKDCDMGWLRLVGVLKL